MRPCFAVSGLVTLLLAGLPIQAKDPPPPLAPQDRLVVLPIEFDYLRYGFKAPVEVDVERSERAKRNLEASLQRAMKRAPSQQFIALPELSADEAAIVSEHTKFLRVIAAATTANVAEGSNPPWPYVIWPIEYSIGIDLAFLAERAGVDRAIFVGGARASGYKVLTALVVDLRSGELLWYCVPVRGFAGEPDDVAGANTWMHALFGVIPDRFARRPARADNSPPEKLIQHPRPRNGFSFALPARWYGIDDRNGMECGARHRPGMESICIDHKLLDDALRAQGVALEADPIKLGEIAVGLLKASYGLVNVEVTSLTPARVASRDGFRVELASHRSVDGTPMRERHLIYGVAGPRGAYMLRFDAPAIYYFERYLPEFEAMVNTFKLMKRPTGTAAIDGQ
jgi:hypothetical protein